MLLFRTLPRAEANSILLSVCCEMVCSIRFEGGARQLLKGLHLHEQSLLWQRVEEKRRPGVAHSTVGTRVCVTMAWTLILLGLLAHHGGREGPWKHRADL